jgi:hypothetical protein
MTTYSLIKIGNDYVVRADDQCILKVGSRRRAASLISEAIGLLNAEAPPQPRAALMKGVSLDREAPELP